MAYDNATTVQVDADANGSFELTQTLAMGQNYRVAWWSIARSARTFQ